jgi:parallel beta-helix repeat protein
MAVKRLLLVIFAAMLFASTVWIQISPYEVNAAESSEKKLTTYKIYNQSSDIPNINKNGNIYTLTSNVEGCISIVADDVILDGAGYTIKGTGDFSDGQYTAGIILYDQSNVIVKNVNVENFNWGIRFTHKLPQFDFPPLYGFYDPNPNHPTNCEITNCHVLDCSSGIEIDKAENCKVTANYLKDNGEGITFSGVGNVFKENQMVNNQINFVDYYTQEGNIVEPSNTVNGKPIYYLFNQQNVTVPADAGMVYLESCNDVTVQNLEINHAVYGVTLNNCRNCKIIQNSITQSQVGILLNNSIASIVKSNQIFNDSTGGIKEDHSEKTVISNNLIKWNNYGIYSVESRYTQIFSNQIFGNSDQGIDIIKTECNITKNYLNGNGQGISFLDISNSMVHKNIITQNRDLGLSMGTGWNASVVGNEISKNGVGIIMDTAAKCTIAQNNIAQNNGLALRIDGTGGNNIFLGNNFIGNNNDSIQVTIKGRFVWHGDPDYDENSKVFPQFAAGYANQWDNNSVGNFWSDYNPTAGDTYKIDKNNQDRHPQAAQFQFAQLEMPQVGSETPQLSLPIYEQLSGIATALAVLAIAIVATAILYEKRIKKQVGS